jgi:hypothetical protein
MSDIQKVVPPLLEQGGNIPIADGQVPEEVPFENYVYYRQILRKETTS